MQQSYRISTWAIVVFVVLVSGLALFALYAWSRVERVNEASKAIEENWLPSTRLLGRMEADALAYRVAAMQHVLSLEEAEMRRYEAEMDSALASMNGSRRRYEPLVASTEEQALYDAFVATWERHLAASQAALDLSRENENREAIARLRQDSQALFDQAYADLEALIGLNVETATALSRQGDDILSDFQLTLVMALLLGGALLLLILADVFGGDLRRRAGRRLPRG